MSNIGRQLPCIDLPSSLCGPKLRSLALPSQVTERRGHQLVSTLVIERADMRHAGKFTCAPSYAKPDTVTLHVVDGE